MDSKSLFKLNALSARNTVKIQGAVTTGNSGATKYFLRPSIPCKLIGARLMVVTAAGANMSAAATFKKSKQFAAPSIQYNTLTPAGSLTGGTDAGKTFMGFAATAVATANTCNHATPGNDYADAENAFSPDNKDVIVVEFPKTSHATLMAATLEIELLPL